MGPFEVLERIGKVAYKLKLSEEMKMHNVFHVSLLKEYRSDGSRIPPPIPEEIAGEMEYEMEQVLSYDGRRKKFLVKWLGYGHENNTWEPEKNLKNSSKLVQEYWDLVRLREQRRGTDTRPSNSQTEKGKENEGESLARRSTRLGRKRKQWNE